MPEVKFGKKDEPGVTLKRSEDLIAIRTRSNRSLSSGPVRMPAAAEVNDGELVLAFPEAGVEVYKVPTERGRTVNERKMSLRGLPDVRFAGGVLIDETSGEPVVYTENLFIKFIDDAEPEECRKVIKEAGLEIKRELDYASNAFFVAAAEGIGTRIFDIANALLERPDVEYCHPEVVRKRGFRAISPQQWHLAVATVNGTQITAHANVEAAHRLTLGQGVTIAVIDDGVDIDHPEFRSSGKIIAPRDVTLRNDDPRPKDPHPTYTDDHGTACAGVACADGTQGASGVAPKARLIPIRLSSGLGSQAEADAFKWAADNGADIISCSWGPVDGDWFDPNDPYHRRTTPLPASTRLALDYAIENGRGGKGCVILFAAGNGNESVDTDGYASYPKVMAVAACNDRGKRSVYSDFGKAIWCAFPSGDFGHAPFSHPEPLTPGIWTTDRHGPQGYNIGDPRKGDPAGNYTNSFSGTSSACPGAAGVAALVLSANPQLRWYEVRDVLRRSCDKIDSTNGAYDADGWSKYYGYGRLNAEKAVRLARPALKDSVTIVRNFNRKLPDLKTVQVALDVSEAQLIDSLAVDLDILHSYIGDLVVKLIPPNASTSSIVLHNRVGGARRNIKQRFDVLSIPALASFKGKSAQGRWILEVQDKQARDEGTLVRFGLELDFMES